MSALAAIWWTSAFVAAAAVVLLVVLVFRRISIQLIGRYRRSRQEQLLNALTKVVNSGDPLQAMKSYGRWSKSDLDCALALRALKSVVRRRRDAMMEQLQRLDLDIVCKNALSGDDADEKKTAIDLVRFLDDRAYARSLRQAAERSGHEIRNAAVRLLIDWNEIPSVEWLFRIMKVDERRPDIETEALFQRIRVPVSYWKRELMDPRAPVGGKILAIYGLAHSGGAAERTAILQMLDHEAPDVRAQALRVLGLLREQAVRPRLGRMLRDPEWFVRAQAAFCCGRLEAEEYVPRLLILLNSGFWWERYRAALALYRLGDRGISALRDAIPFAGRPGRTASIVLAEFGITG